jgi:ribosomal protein S18 acetylase RimI-like enzyme
MKGVYYQSLDLLRSSEVEAASDEVVGLATYGIEGMLARSTIDALVEGRGVGSSLVEAVHERAHRAGCARLWLVTTNGNERAQLLYDKLGFRVFAVREGAVTEWQKLKPSIPLVARADRHHRRDRVRATDPLTSGRLTNRAPQS